MNLLIQVMSLLVNPLFARRPSIDDRLGNPKVDATMKDLDLPGTSDRVLLLAAPCGPGAFRNLLRQRSDGTIVWHARLPRRLHDCDESVESYTDAAVTDSLGFTWLEAESSPGGTYRIDLRTGRLFSGPGIVRL